MSSFPHLSGGTMVLGFILMFAGALLFISRPEAVSQPTGSSRLVLERTLILAAVVLTSLGFLLLKEHLASTPGNAWILIGAYLYLFGSVLIVSAELLGLSGARRVSSLVVAYVLLAFLSQAAVGAAIIQSGTMPALLGWVTIGWNIAWMIILPLTTPADIYFPVLHHLMPLAIGIVLLSAP